MPLLQNDHGFDIFAGSLASPYGKRGWSRVLGAYTSQVKSWFQKRRTHTEEDETTLVPHENDEKLRAENVLICDGHQDPEHPPRQSKRSYHRHTPRQIQELETMFKECPHPDEKQRQRLSAEFGLQPRQVKFWFQSRRTQMKAQTERADKTLLRQENDKLRSENILMREALKNTTCQHCGGPSTLGEMSLHEQQLRIENGRLTEELDRVSALDAKYLGRFSQIHTYP